MIDPVTGPAVHRSQGRVRSRAWRTFFAAALVIGVSAVPIATVMACDCAMSELPDAVRDADLAIVATLVGQGGPGQPALAEPNPGERQYTWQVERSRDPLDTNQVTLTAWEDDGANCGVRFATEERWLVLGYVEEGRLLTNGCMRNMRLDGSDPEGEAMVDSLVPVAVTASPVTSELSIPFPLIVVGGAALLIGLIGLVAFRRGAAASA